VKTNQEIRMGHVARALLAATSALLLVVGLWLMFSHFQVLAQPTAETAALTVDKQANAQYAVPGDRLTYTIRIEDMSAFYPTLWMTDTLPDDVTYVPGSLQHLELPGRSVGYANGVITWTASNFGYGFDIITFSVEISSETTAAQIVNTAQVTGTGDLTTASETTNILSGLPPNSQIRSPNRDAVITHKGSLTISGIAWDEGIEPPYLLDDPVLSVQRQADRVYYVAWTDVVSAEHYTLQEATQPDFSDSTSSVLPASSTNQLVSKDANEDDTYYYRVQASRYGLGPSRWSNMESVVVPWTAAFTDLPASALSTDVAANGPMTVQVCIDECVEPADWHNAVVTATAWGGWEWSHEWSPLPEEDDVQHAIHTRASSEEGVFGPTDTITVTLRNKNYIMHMPLGSKRWPAIPFAPTLNNIENSDEDDNYTVRWSYDDDDPGTQDPTSYTLQEAKNAPENFRDVYSGSSTSRQFTDKDDGTYYYRVRGHNNAGPGSWSAVKSVTVRSRSYKYDFERSFAKPAWPIRRTSLWEGDEWGGTWTEEHDGTMYALMNDRFDFAIASPWEEAPDPPYVIKVKVRVHDPANLAAYGIIFGGNGGSPCPAYRESGCLTHYYRLEAIWDGALKAGLKRIDKHESDKGHGQGTELIGYQYVADSGEGDGWHTWKFKVKSNGIDVYFDSEHIGSTSDTKYVNDPYFGVYVSANEYKPAIGRFDYYYVEPD
jgi:uncharacterized repeat protein (TIGR01451 family)